MQRYAKLMKNDIVDGEGICVSLWTQGCPHRCAGCHNPETWDFNGGEEIPNDIKNEIITAISANGIMRNFSVLGGEPLCKENRAFVRQIVQSVRVCYPAIKIFLWTGYLYEDLLEKNDLDIDLILECVDTLIDGPYMQEERDITLPLCGSRNQRVLNLKE